MVTLPVALAAVKGASKALKVLLLQNPRQDQVDHAGNNAIHSIIQYANQYPEQEKSMIEMYELIVSLLPRENLKEMLHQENSAGLRAIEFAAQHGKGSFVLAIMNTTDVYLLKKETHGLLTYKWYDIDDYESLESGSRNHYSPLLLMSYIDEAAARQASFDEFMDFSAIQSWFNKKIYLNLPIIIMWCMVRICFVSFTMIFTLDMGPIVDMGSNMTHCVPDSALVLSAAGHRSVAIYLILHAAISMTADIYDFIQMMLPKSRPLYKTTTGWKSLLPQIRLYRSAHFTLCLLILTCSPLMLGYPTEMTLMIRDFSYLASPILATWSILYFIQLLPSIGYFIISIYSMMGQLLFLILVYLLMVIPFYQAFYTFINTNSTQVCSCNNA